MGSKVKIKPLEILLDSRSTQCCFFLVEGMLLVSTVDALVSCEQVSELQAAMYLFSQIFIEFTALKSGCSRDEIALNTISTLGKERTRY